MLEVTSESGTVKCTGEKSQSANEIFAQLVDEGVIPEGAKLLDHEVHQDYSNEDGLTRWKWRIHWGTE